MGGAPAQGWGGDTTRRQGPVIRTCVQTRTPPCVLLRPLPHARLHTRAVDLGHSRGVNLDGRHSASSTGARAGPKRCPGDDAARGSRSAVRRFSKERLGPAPEPEAAL